ncbi:MAG: flagellar export protein FliJ [bacterium]
MIKRFVFRLERVLRHRASVRDLRERESALAREREAVASLVRARDGLLADLAELQRGPFPASERQRYQQHLGWLAGELDHARARAADLEALRDGKRAALVKASQEHRIVERLRERQAESHRLEAGREDQVFLDELATGAYIRAGRALRRSSGPEATS